MTPERRDAYLRECRELVIAQIAELLGDDRSTSLGRAMLDYPLREAKALRPALCIATCRAHGGSLEGALPSAAVLELFHNAFLIHDDVEDGSEQRRLGPTLHSEMGQAAAINVGDAMLAWALEPLLDNMEVLDLGRAIRILEVVARLARESVKGQALELEWFRDARWDIDEERYTTMVVQKTGWYTFVAPLLIGGIVAGADEGWLTAARAFGIDLGIAFQIRDDILNLTGEPEQIGKESCGDLWEGKRTLILAKFFERASEPDRERAKAVLRKPRPPLADDLPAWARVAWTGVTERFRDQAPTLSDDLEREIDAARRREYKTIEEVRELRALLDKYESVEAASAIAAHAARRADLGWSALSRDLPCSIHRELVDSLVSYVAERGR